MWPFEMRTEQTTLNLAVKSSERAKHISFVSPKPVLTWGYLLGMMMMLMLSRSTRATIEVYLFLAILFS